MMLSLRLVLLLRFVLLFQVVRSLSSNGGSSLKKKPVKRVAVIGSGIAGLSLAQALKKNSQDLDVSIFDSRKSFDFTAGSGVQLNGGLSVLGKINPAAQKAVMNAGVPIADIRGRNKSWFRESSTDTLWDYSIEKLIRNAGGDTEKQLMKDGKPVWFGLMRGALQQALYETLDGETQVQFNKTLVGITSQEDSGAFCQFSDGSISGPYDLIVGCDGIKSAVKEYIERGRISKDASIREGSAAAIYSGIRIAYAVQDGKASERKNEETVDIEQIFADGSYFFRGSFGNGPDQSPSNCAFIISLDDNYNGPFGKRKEVAAAEALEENSDWSQDFKKSEEASRKQMLECVATNDIKNEKIIGTIWNADRFFDLGVYFHNPFSLAGWTKEIPSSGGSLVVLCGDAAHAMPPFLGQGSNQGIQDAFCLAQKIQMYNSQIDTESEQDLRPILKKEYEAVRWIPTTSITAKAAILGYLETGGRNGFYSKFRDLFFKTLALLGIPVKVLLDAATPKID